MRNGVTRFGLGVNLPAIFGPDKRRGLEALFLTMVSQGSFVPIPGPNPVET